MDLNETIRRFVMAGVGAVSLTFEKSKDLADALVKKGEETAAENNMSYEQVRDQVVEQLKNLSEKVRSDLNKASFDELLERADDLTDEQREILMDRLAHPLKENEACDCGEKQGCDCAQDEMQNGEPDESADQENADKGE